MAGHAAAVAAIARAHAAQQERDQACSQARQLATALRDAQNALRTVARARRSEAWGDAHDTALRTLKESVDPALAAFRDMVTIDEDGDDNDP